MLLLPTFVMQLIRYVWKGVNRELIIEKSFFDAKLH